MYEEKKVVSLVPSISKKESNPNVVSLEYSDGHKEIIEADAFAFADELPGFIALWKEEPYELLGFINISSIRKLRVIPKESESDEIIS